MAVTATWSPCCRFIAISRLKPATVEIMDAVTLERLTVFKPAQNGTFYQWLSFSPDGRLLTLFDHEWGLASWDIQTGGLAGTIPLDPDIPPSYFLSSTYSLDGKVVAVAHRDLGKTTSAISTYDLHSGAHTYSHHVSEGRIVAPIWTHGECLQFAVVKSGSIAIWEVGFTSTRTPVEVQSLSAPDVDSCSGEYLFLPARSRLALTVYEAVYVWDARDSKLLLDFVSDRRPAMISFSLDGRFFACGTTDIEILLWEESPTGYMLRQTLVSGDAGVKRPLLSPNGESIAGLSSSTIQLWRTTDPTSSTPTIPTQSIGTDVFILEFSPDETLAAVARLRENTATVLNLRSGDSRLIIDTGMEIIGLGVTGNTIVVVGKGKVATWNVPAGDRAPNARANINDSIWTAIFDYSESPVTIMASYTSISPDLNRFAVAWDAVGTSANMNIYDTSTGRCLAGAATEGLQPWFTSNGREVWCQDGSPAKGWTIVEDSESGLAKLEPLGPTMHPSGGLPWRPSRGHEVTSDGWVLNPGGKRLFWLPHHWRSDGMMDRKWRGRFLGLLHSELLAAVILELDE